MLNATLEDSYTSAGINVDKYVGFEDGGIPYVMIFPFQALSVMNE